MNLTGFSSEEVFNIFHTLVERNDDGQLKIGTDSCFGILADTFDILPDDLTIHRNGEVSFFREQGISFECKYNEYGSAPWELVIGPRGDFIRLTIQQVRKEDAPDYFRKSEIGLRGVRGPILQTKDGNWIETETDFRNAIEHVCHDLMHSENSILVRKYLALAAAIKDLKQTFCHADHHPALKSFLSFECYTQEEHPNATNLIISLQGETNKSLFNVLVHDEWLERRVQFDSKGRPVINQREVPLLTDEIIKESMTPQQTYDYLQGVLNGKGFPIEYKTNQDGFSMRARLVQKGIVHVDFFSLNGEATLAGNKEKVLSIYPKGDEVVLKFENPEVMANGKLFRLTDAIRDKVRPASFRLMKDALEVVQRAQRGSYGSELHGLFFER